MIAATEEREKEISASWERPMLRLTQALPEWIYPYIQQPDEKYSERDSQSHESIYTYVPITVPGCNPIAAWVSPNTNDVRYEVMEPHLHHDDEDDVWYVADAVKWHRETVWGIQQLGDPDIAVTLFRAHDAYLKRLELVAQAEQRNAYEPETLLVPAPEPEPDPAPAVPDPIDQARQLVAMLSNDERIKRTMAATTKPTAPTVARSCWPASSWPLPTTSAVWLMPSRRTSNHVTADSD